MKGDDKISPTKGNLCKRHKITPRFFNCLPKKKFFILFLFLKEFLTVYVFSMVFEHIIPKDSII